MRRRVFGRGGGGEWCSGGSDKGKGAARNKGEKGVPVKTRRGGHGEGRRTTGAALRSVIMTLTMMRCTPSVAVETSRAGSMFGTTAKPNSTWAEVARVS